MAGEQATKAHKALYPLSYAAIIAAAGIEPATSRSQGEVTIVYATGQKLFTAEDVASYVSIHHYLQNRSGNN